MPTVSTTIDAALVARLRRDVVRWYRANARDLPWRRPGAGAWGVLVSEVMLQQTPVARVLPVYRRWLTYWPTPSALAAEEPAAAIRAWGRLGYPRRALRLHAAARVIDEEHGGEVPTDEKALRELPGIGDYTAAAVMAFAFGRRATVLDTNVRRVHARVLDGHAHPPTAVTIAERTRAGQLLPRADKAAAEVSIAMMELGALVCTARSPSCPSCPLAGDCRWLALGRTQSDQVKRRAQTYEGTDRQARGALLAMLRAADSPVQAADLAQAWAPDGQRDRALASLVADGLAVPQAAGYSLPDG